MKLQRAGKKTWLSHSGLDILYRCPRCFWLQYRLGIRQPQGIFSRLPSRFDKILKNYFNSYRQKNELPPFLQGKLKGKLENPFQEVYFYHVNQKYGFYGKLDECLITPEGKHIIIDYKTASSDPRPRKEVFPSYQRQMNEYAFLLEENRKPTEKTACLIYLYPDEIKDLAKGVPLVIHFQEVKTDSKEVLPRLAEAINILEAEMPEPADDCSFCQWHNEIKELTAKQSDLL